MKTSNPLVERAKKICANNEPTSAGGLIRVMLMKGKTTEEILPAVWEKFGGQADNKHVAFYRYMLRRANLLPMPKAAKASRTRAARGARTAKRSVGSQASK